MKVTDGNIVMDSAEEVKMQGAILSRPIIKDYSESYSGVSSSGGDATLDLEDGSVCK